MPYPGYVLSHVQFTMIVGVSYECKICSDTLRYQTGSVLTRQSGVSRFEAIVCCGALSACDLLYFGIPLYLPLSSYMFGARLFVAVEFYSFLCIFVRVVSPHRVSI